MPIDCDLYSTAIEVWQAVGLFLEIDPGRHRRRTESIVTAGRTEIKYFLPGGVNPFAEEPGKYFWEPRPAGENESFCRDPPAAHRHNLIKLLCIAGRQHRFLQKLDTSTDRLPHHHLDCAARQNCATVRFE